jgi:hypothetical protein
VPDDQRDGQNDPAAASPVAALFAQRPPVQIAAAGNTGRPLKIPVEPLQNLLHNGLVIAAGLDPTLTASPPPPVLWSDGANRLLVHIARAQARLGEGFVDVTLPVQCDETGMASVICTFVTSTPDKPGGFVWACESRPRGPAVIVTLWGDPLVALAWRALVELSGTIASYAGRDRFDRPLVPGTVFAARDGLTVVPMAPHVFPQTGDTP